MPTEIKGLKTITDNKFHKGYRKYKINYHLQKDQDAQGKLSSSACAFCTHLPDLQSFEDGVLQKDHTKNQKNLVNHTHKKNNTKNVYGGHKLVFIFSITEKAYFILNLNHVGMSNTMLM